MSGFLDPHRDIAKHGDRLPHWQQDQVVQFVTFRLGDSLPAELLKQWTEARARWLRRHPEPWDDDTRTEYHRRFTDRFEGWLDMAHGSCLLRSPDVRFHLEETLMHDHGTRVVHHTWVIMPNHVHLLFTPKWPLDRLLQSWKGVSARRIGHGPIWQRNYRDTLIRSHRHFAAVVRYIRRNPAKLPRGTFTLWESEPAKQI